MDFSKAFVKNAYDKLYGLYADFQGRVKFVVGDGCNLDPSHRKISIISGGNLVDSLQDPSIFLKSVSSFPDLTLRWLEVFTHTDNGSEE